MVIYNDCILIAVSINYLCVLRFNPCCFSSLIHIIHSGSFTLWLPSRCDQKKELVKKKKKIEGQELVREIRAFSSILLLPWMSLMVAMSPPWFQLLLASGLW